MVVMYDVYARMHVSEHMCEHRGQRAASGVSPHLLSCLKQGLFVVYYWILQDTPAWEVPAIVLTLSPNHQRN